jgi:prepilin-type N-terminal cleavage/methylation domain-containing protein
MTMTFRYKKAFSLIEIIIAMALFLTVALIISDIFLGVSRAEEKSLANVKVSNDISFAMAQLKSLIRNAKIDYAAYGGAINSTQTELRMIDESGKTMVIKISKGFPVQENSAILVETPDASYTLTPNDIAVQKMSFFIGPAKDPFTPDPITKKYPADEQPRMTVALTVAGTTGKPADRIPINMQTTLSFRKYER